MNIFKKLFGSEDKKDTNDSVIDENIVLQSEFGEGDIFYTHFSIESGSPKVFYIEKLLKIDDEFNTYHVKSFRPLEKLPSVIKEEDLEIFAEHAPIDKNGFDNPKLLIKSKVTAADLSGYHEYLRQTTSVDEIISIAQNYYLKANDLADERKFEESIDEYSKAVDLIPEFYEAIENRAFSRMDLGCFNEAIKDFEMSLKVFPESLSGIFSIGDCYLRMGKIKEAEIYFNKVLAVNPDDELANKFLKHLAEWRKNGLQDEETNEKVAAFLNYVKNN